MMQSGNHRELIVWQKAMDLTMLVYDLCYLIPNDEKYALKSQLRRAVISIPANIAEGRRRGSEKEFKHFLRIAYGSAAEVETYLEIASRLKYFSKEKANNTVEILVEVMKMLNRMTRF